MHHRTLARSKRLAIAASLSFFVSEMAIYSTAFACQDAKSNPPASQPAAAAAKPATMPASAPTAAKSGFTGRWRLGPDKAPIRIVMLGDYQCTLCRAVETEAIALVESRKDVSLSMKHFPMCMDCNKFATQNMHPNACWAARAAEAAGMLGGNDAFWKMHKWLFQKGGGFTDAELQASVTGMGFNWDEFKKLMQGDETLTRVRADVDEGQNLGLYFTPMVFINGIEMRGVTAQTQKLTQAVEFVAKLNPVPMGPENDTPPAAADKVIGDWRESPRENPVGDDSPWQKGPTDAAVRITIFGDYGVPGMKEMWDDVTVATKDAKNVRIQFRHFPFDKSCNKNVQNPANNSLFGCEAARAAEAAGKLGGQAAYWRMHDFLLENQKQFSPDFWALAGGKCGLQADAFAALMRDPTVQTAIEEDIAAAMKMHVSRVPYLFINERPALRWKLTNGDDVLKRLIEEAAKPTTPTK